MGKDLSEADFSEADIRGANFSRANLTGTNFAGAKAGVQRCWVAVQWVLVLVVSALLGFLVIVPGWWFAIMINSIENLTDLLVLGVPTATALVATLFVIARQGFTVQAVSSSAIAISGVIAIAIAVAIPVQFNIPFAIGIAGSVAIIGAIAIAITFAITIAVAAAIAIAAAIAVAVAAAVAIASSITFIRAVSIVRSPTIAIAITIAITAAFILLSIYVAWRAMKGDKKFAIIRQFAIAFGSLGGTRFYSTTLTDANFTGATLKSCNFLDATLVRTCWKDAQKLDRARPGDTLLANAAVRQLLITGNGYNQSYIGANLHGANLTGVNLERANLKRADLSHATLHQANLKDSNLTETLALSTDFTAAYLTGACLEAWNLDSTTQLAGVDCQYVFLLERENDNGSRERRPHDPDRVFQPGDFEKLYQKMMNVVQILLRNGIDKEAFKDAFQKLMEEYPDLTCDSIQGIERKGKDFLLTVQIPETADKSQVERLFHEAYDAKLAAAKAAGELEAEKRRSQDMKDIVLALAEKSSADIKVEQTSHNQTITENQAFTNHQGDLNMNDRTINMGDGDYREQTNVNDRATYVEGNYQNHSNPVETQQLLQILDRSYPSDIPADTQAEIDVAVKGIAKNPALKERVVGALKAGGIEALKELTENPYVNILLAAYEGWQSP